MRMYKQTRTDTCKSLARKAIISVFNKDFYREQEEIISFYQEYLNSNNVSINSASQSFRFSWLKQARRIITYRLTKSLIQTLPMDWQKFAKMYYFADDNQVKICNEIHIASQTLNNWDYRLLDMVVYYAILLRISKNDLFHLPRLVNIVNALSELTLLIKKLDCNADSPIVPASYKANIAQRMANYRAIITALTTYKTNRDQGLMPMIISVKCNNPDAKNTTIALECNIHPSVVNKYVNEFYTEIYKYLV